MNPERLSGGDLVAGTIIPLAVERWTAGRRIACGHFGCVYEADSASGGKAALKVVPYSSAGLNEIQMVRGLAGPGVVKLLDVGQHNDNLVIAMDLGDCSLRQHIARQGTLAFDEVRDIALDLIAGMETLASANPPIIHRDIKPENIIRIDSTWCLSDFGIARYADADTRPETWKAYHTPSYTAPELFKGQRATSQSDIYALCIVIIEMLNGQIPYTGTMPDEIEEDRKAKGIPQISEIPRRIATVIERGLEVVPTARPTLVKLRDALTRSTNTPNDAQSILIQADDHVAETRRKSEEAMRTAIEQANRRQELQSTAIRAYRDIYEIIKEQATDSLHELIINDNNYELRLGEAILSISQPHSVQKDRWEGNIQGFDVLAEGLIQLSFPADRSGYRGRAHSLWYCEAEHEDEFGWYETAFADISPQGLVEAIQPTAYSPGEKTNNALHKLTAFFVCAWRPRDVLSNDTDEFTKRWIDWLARAALKQLHRPRQLPEERWSLSDRE